jgi:TonB family protein
MDCRGNVLGAVWVSMLAACTAPPSSAPGTEKSAAVSAPQLLDSAPLLPPLTADGYKREFAEQVARASPEVFAEPIPEMLKSVVVLEITIDRSGALRRATVRRSNGYRALENLALESVRRAAPYAAPPWTVRNSDGSLTFLETFLFRDDGRFRILSLVR